jgi:hypothetical protein
MSDSTDNFEMAESPAQEPVSADPQDPEDQSAVPTYRPFAVEFAAGAD